MEPLRRIPAWELLLNEFRENRDDAMRRRLRMIPGSDEDMDQYLKARAIDELIVQLDTIDKAADIARANKSLGQNN